MARSAALTAALAASLLAVSGASGAGAQTPKRGGTLVVGTLRELPCLNAYLERCHQNFPALGFMVDPVLRGAFRMGSDFSWEPDLVSRADVVSRKPFTVVYRIRPEARWSDGTPITARDFVFTQRVLRDHGDAHDEHRTGIRGARALAARRVEVTFRSPVSGWRGFFPRVLPAHALRGEDFATVWSSRIHNPKTGRRIGSGPFLLEDWERGRELRYVRNPRYWGSHRAYLDRIVLRLAISGAADQVERLRSGELDLVQSIVLGGEDVQQLRGIRDLEVRVRRGPIWEHFEIRRGDGGSPLLRRKLVRRALVYGMSRASIARQLFGEIDARYPPSQSALFLDSSRYYRANWSAYRFRPVEARKLLEREGCRRGADGIYSCDGQRVSFRFLTTAGDERRRRTLELVQDQLRQAGVEVVPQYSPSNVALNQILRSGNFDVILYTHVRGPSYLDGYLAVFGCGGAENHTGYCQHLVTRNLHQVARMHDLARQASLLNKVDAQLARDVPLIPLVQRPLVAAFGSDVRNVVLGAGFDPFYNAENWWLDR